MASDRIGMSLSHERFVLDVNGGRYWTVGRTKTFEMAFGIGARDNHTFIRKILL